MPPRYAFWTILIDQQPTAFRARERDELVPTLVQLQRTQPGAQLKWFAHGQLWDSPDQQQWAQKNRDALKEKRSGDWRPGGAHKDPRAKFQKSKDRRRPPRTAAGGAPRTPSRPAPRADTRPAPRADARPAPRTAARPLPSTATRPLPHATTRPAPRTGSRPAPRDARPDARSPRGPSRGAPRGPRRDPAGRSRGPKRGPRKP